MADDVQAALRGSATQPPSDSAVDAAYQQLLSRNREWAAAAVGGDPAFFSRHAGGQQPTFLFIGCSDSRVPAELLTGAGPGELFVHRNVANLVPPADANVMSVLNYAVDALKVKAVVVCGHYACGGVRASLGAEPHGFVDHWLGHVREVTALHREELDGLAPGPGGARERRLVELNALEQARHVRRSPVVQAAWARGQALAVYAMAYDIADGSLRDLGPVEAGGVAAAAAGTGDGARG